MIDRRFVVMFVSRRNSLRSVLAEACLAHIGSKRFAVFSCGNPEFLAKDVHPAALGALVSAGIPVPSQPRRSWSDLARLGAPRADFVITLDESTVVDQPIWPGQPDSASWPFPDAAALGEREKVAHAAIHTLYALRRRLELLISLPLHGADRAAIRSDVRDMAHLP